MVIVRQLMIRRRRAAGVTAISTAGGRQIAAKIPTFGATVIWDFGLALKLFRIKSERLKLPAPYSRGIAEPLDTDAAGQATFYGCFDKIGGEEG
jgi:hypothetical protein